VNVAESMLEDVGEANEHRKADPAELQAINQLLEVYGLGGVFRWVHLDVASVVDRDIAVTPPRDFVQLGGLMHAPGTCRRGGGCDWHRPSVGHSAHERDDKRLSVSKRAIFSGRDAISPAFALCAASTFALRGTADTPRDHDGKRERGILETRDEDGRE
jgi:hypothetical protein